MRKYSLDAKETVMEKYKKKRHEIYRKQKVK